MPPAKRKTVKNRKSRKTGNRHKTTRRLKQKGGDDNKHYLFPIVGINETEIVLLIKLYSPESYLQPSSLSRVYVEVEPTSESLSLGPYNVNNKTPILGFIRDTLKLNIEGLTLICNENIIGEEDIFSKLIIEDADISNLSEINIQSLKDTVVEMAEVGSNIEDESSTF